METKHTKGEWAVKDDFREPKIVNESGQIIFTHNKNCFDSDGNVDAYYSHNKMMSNAKLIAASPTLLKALMTIYSMAQDGDVLINKDLPFYEMIENAINKATK